MSYESRPYQKYIDRAICLETLFTHIPHLGIDETVCPCQCDQPHCVICGLYMYDDTKFTSYNSQLICQYCMCQSEGCTNPRHSFLPEGQPMTTISTLYPSTDQREPEPYALYPTCSLHMSHRCPCGKQLSIRYRERLCPICREFCRIENCQSITINGYSFCKKHSGACHFIGCKKIVSFHHIGSNPALLATSKILPHYCSNHQCIICDRMVAFGSNKCIQHAQSRIPRSKMY